jgi:predicted nucleotidyltransferase
MPIGAPERETFDRLTGGSAVADVVARCVRAVTTFMKGRTLLEFMNSDEVQRSDDLKGPYITLPLPVPDEGLFRYGATPDLLWLLASDHDESFTHRELARQTEYSLNAVNQAIEALEAVGWVEVTPTAHGNEVHIDQDALVKPDDPILRIPQSEFHRPVRELTQRLRDELAGVEGVVLYGSVARGDADRSSDLDLFVLVSEDAPRNQRLAHDIESEFESRQFDGQRYTPHVLVDSPATVTSGDDQYDAIFREGIVLHGSDALSRVRHSVLSTSGGSADGG